MVPPVENLPPLNIPALLRAHGLKPKKSLGQNFLLDPAALSRVVKAAEITPKSIVLEIGPGPGTLTRHLAASAQHVIAVELDGNFIPVLHEVLSPFENVTIIHGDILDQDLTTLMDQSGAGPMDEYLVVANIPYNITSLIIRHLLESKRKPSRMILTIQNEVADRICAKAGALSLLALSVQVYGKPSKVTRIPAGAFFPQPKVDSATLRIDLHPTPLLPSEDLDTFFQLIKAGFSQKRKTLRNTLSAGLRIKPGQAVELLAAANIDPMRRAQTLNLHEWFALVTAKKNH